MVLSVCIHSLSMNAVRGTVSDTNQLTCEIFITQMQKKKLVPAHKYVV